MATVTPQVKRNREALKRAGFDRHQVRVQAQRRRLPARLGGGHELMGVNVFLRGKTRRQELDATEALLREGFDVSIHVLDDGLPGYPVIHEIDRSSGQLRITDYRDVDVAAGQYPRFYVDDFDFLNELRERV